MYPFHIQKKNILGAAILGIAAFLFSCENDIQQIKSFDDTVQLPIQSGTNIEIIYSDSARVKLQINAPEMERYYNEEEGNFVIFPKGIHVQFFDGDLNVQTDLKSNYARHLEKEDRWEVRDNVVIVNRKGEIVATEEMIWDRVTGKVYNDKFVKITTPEEVLMGDGFESDEQFLNYEIINSRGVFNMKEDE